MSSAREQSRQLFNELMGMNNIDYHTKKRIKFYSHKICKPFLLNCCPHDYIGDVKKANMGECRFIHSILAREQYNNHPKKDKFNYEKDAYEVILDMIGRAERDYVVNSDKVRMQQKEIDDKILYMKRKINKLTEEIDDKLSIAEKFGSNGRLKESQVVVEQVLVIKNEKCVLENELETAINHKNLPGARYNVSVCEVCGGFINTNKYDSRREDHLIGKYHTGYLSMREKREDLKLKCDQIMSRTYEQAMQKLERKNQKNYTRKHNAESSSDSHHSRSKSRSKSQSKSRSKSRSKSNSNSRSRSRSKLRSNSKSSQSERDSRSKSESIQKKRKRSHHKKSHRRHKKRKHRKH